MLDEARLVISIWVTLCRDLLLQITKQKAQLQTSPANARMP